MDYPIEFLAWIASAFSDYKTLLQHSIGFHNDALHVFFGIAIQLVAALLLRRTLADWQPLAAVGAFEIVNEISDFLVEIWPTPPAQLGESVKDFTLTVSIPILLFVVARFCPGLLHRDTAAGSVKDTARTPD